MRSLRRLCARVHGQHEKVIIGDSCLECDREQFSQFRQMDREGRATRDREIPKIKGHFITKIIEALLFFQVITSISTMNFRFCLVETANQRRKWFWRLI